MLLLLHLLNHRGMFRSIFKKRTLLLHSAGDAGVHSQSFLCQVSSVWCPSDVLDYPLCRLAIVRAWVQKNCCKSLFCITANQQRKKQQQSVLFLTIAFPSLFKNSPDICIIFSSNYVFVNSGGN